jgi:hypothetical protein
MVLAMVILAGTSAMAQDGLSISSAIWHMPASVHGVKVVENTNTAYSWVINNVNCTDGSTAATSNGASIAAVTDENWKATITYTAAATGVYRIEVTETTTTAAKPNCSTVREFFTAIMDANLVVIASNSDGTVAGLALESCNDYSLAANNGSDLVNNVDTDDNSDNLNGWNDATNTSYNQRWAKVTLSVSSLVSGAGCTVDNAPEVTDYDWQFDYEISGTNMVDGTNDNYLGLQAATTIEDGSTGTGAVTLPDPATVATGTISVSGDASSFVLPIRSMVRWGLSDVDQDQQLIVTVSSLGLDSDSDTDTDYDDGGESTTNAAAGNVSDTQVIHASPATPRITIDD